LLILSVNQGWVPLCKHLPDLAVDILEGILCRKPRPDGLGSLRAMFFEGVSTLEDGNPPTPYKGPFMVFLHLHPEQGLELIQRVVNHATSIWVLRENEGEKRKPLPQILKLASSDVEVQGDSLVFHWYRYPSLGPDAVVCALMALEEWMNERIRSGTDAKELFEKVLRRTNSAAVVGVCTSVALANINACVEAIIPILEKPAFWEMDIARMAQDQTAEASAKAFSEYFSLGRDKSDYKKLIQLAQQPHRRYDIRAFITPILFSAPQEICERVQAAIRAFPAHPPQYYEDENQDKRLIQRDRSMRIWATLAEKDNYIHTLEKVNQITIEFKFPEN
jgi:hypothetical protein